MMRKRVTLKTVAQTVGVSTSAVSLALRNHPRVSEAKREEIKQAARSLGYVYNRSAANLRKGKSDIISVCINDMANPVFSEFLIGIEDEFRRQGKLVILCNANEDREIQRDFIDRMLEQGSAGLLLSPVNGTPFSEIEDLVRHDFPTVLFSRSFEHGHFDQVINDDALGVDLAVEELVRRGHRRIAWIGGGQKTSTANARLTGFRRAVRRHGLPAGSELINRTDITSLESGRIAMDELLQITPSVSAVICFSDLLALGALASCRAHGLEAGREISIIGYDDIEEASYFVPALTTVHVDKAMIGRTAAKMLLKRIRKPGNDLETKIIRPRLVIRETVGDAVNPG